MSSIRRISTAVVAAVAMTSLGAQALELNDSQKKALAAAKGKSYKTCIFDPLGRQGPAFNYAKDYSIEALNHGLNLQLEAYTDEKIAAEDFKAGNCDAVVITGLRARQFNKFAGTIDSVGGITSYEQMRTLVSTLAKPELGKFMVEGKYEIAAVIPLGAAYIMVNDRRIDTPEKASGKKVAVLDYDKSQAKLVGQMGANPVSSDITNFSGKFNNGAVDIIAAPAVAFRPLELYRGVGSKGSRPG